jgi:hypothetical protein
MFVSAKVDSKHFHGSENVHAIDHPHLDQLLCGLERILQTFSMHYGSSLEK